MKLSGISLRKKIGSLAALAFLAVATVSAHATERAVKSRVAPVYPELAKRMRISGVVNVDATVDADGKVTDAKATTGNRLLESAAEDAVRKWKFEAGSGTDVVHVAINFQME
jgi:TonB family protein